MLQTKQLSEKDQHALNLITGIIESQVDSYNTDVALFILGGLLYTEPFYEMYKKDSKISDTEITDIKGTKVIHQDGLLQSLYNVIQSLASDLKPMPDDFDPDHDEDEGDFSIDLTIGCSWKNFGSMVILEDYGVQSGDNSYSGGAYFHPHWGVATITSEHQDSVKAIDLVIEILNDSLEQFTA